MVALHLLQSALVHVNTLLLQNVLDTPGGAELLGEHEHRARSCLTGDPVPDRLGAAGPHSWVRSMSL